MYFYDKRLINSVCGTVTSSDIMSAAEEIALREKFDWVTKYQLLADEYAKLASGEEYGKLHKEERAKIHAKVEGQFDFVRKNHHAEIWWALEKKQNAK